MEDTACGRYTKESRLLLTLLLLFALDRIDYR
jgi:hypothetical protein